MHSDRLCEKKEWNDAYTNKKKIQSTIDKDANLLYLGVFYSIKLFFFF